MRRFGTFFVLLLLILGGVGCRRTAKAVTPITTDFSCEFRGVYRELAVAGTLTRRSAGSISLQFTEPSTLNGLTATWDGESVKLSLLGLTYTVSPESVPEAALGKELLSVLDAVLQNEGKTDGDAVTLNGICNNHEYTYRYDTQSGAPISLSVPALPLSITFTNCKSTN